MHTEVKNGIKSIAGLTAFLVKQKSLTGSKIEYSRYYFSEDEETLNEYLDKNQTYETLSIKEKPMLNTVLIKQ